MNSSNGTGRNQKLTLAYVAGCPRSGSTLVNRLLGAHPEAITLGSVKMLETIVEDRRRCSCGEPNLFECAFWQSIDEELRRDGKSLSGLRLRTRRNSRFEEDNLALFYAVQRVTGARVIVDSSRRSSRLQRLSKMAELDVVPIHLYKTPVAQAGSWKSRNTLQCVVQYWARHTRILNATRDKPNTTMLSYEYLCQHPESELSRLFSCLNLDDDPSVLERWGTEPLHALGGNRMRFKTSSEIYLDDGWRERLSPAAINMVRSSCGILWKSMSDRQFGPHQEKVVS